MRNIKILFISMIFFLLMISISDVSASTFTYYTVGIDDGTANHLTTPQSFLWDLPCSVSFTEFATLKSNTFPYTASFDWYSPDGTLILSFPASYSSNITCSNIGTASSSTGINNSYTTKTTMTTSASSHNTWVLNEFQCDIPSNNIIFLEVNSSTPFDYNGYFPYDYQRTFTCYGFAGCSLPSQSSDVTTIISDLNLLHYGIVNTPKSCSISSGITQSQARSTTSPAVGTNRMGDWQIISFHNYYSTKVNISVLSDSFSAFCVGIGACSCNAGTNNAVWLYDPVSNTSTQLSATVPYSASYTLKINQEYWLLIYGDCGVATGSFGSTITFNYPRFNITINAYQPNLNCSDWTNCINNQQTRYCTDLNGIISPFIDQRSCFEFAQQQEFLGFDDYNSVNVWYCSEGSLFSGCSMSSELKTRKYPKNWTIVSDFVTDSATGRSGYLQDFVDMSSSEYYQQDAGTTETSLKMWYIPRKSWLPKFNESGDNQVRCNETTEGRVPYVYRDINQSFWIARNITATSPYMSLSYRLKKCDEPELQTTGGFGCFGLGLTKGCNSTGIDLYTWNGCTEQPKTTIGVSVRDLDLSLFVIDYAQEVTANTFEEGYFEDIINNMQLNHTYEIEFAVPPKNGLQDPNSYCVYIDDVNINFRNVQITCESGCYNDYDQNGILDYTYLEAIPRDSSSCSVKLFELDQRCVPTDVSDEVASKQDFCIGLRLYTYNNVTEIWETVENAQKCITQQQQANITGINPIISGVLVGMNITQNDVQNSGLGFLLTTIFIVFIIDMAISGYATYKISQKAQNTHWEIFAIAMIGLIIIETIPPLNVFPLWFSVVFVIFISLFLAEFILRRYRGG